MQIGQAVNEAVDWAIEENFLEGFVREQKEEIIGMYLTEFNEERAIRGWRQDGIEEGREEKAVEDARNLKSAGVDINIIAKCVGLSVEEVEKL
jgi:predicted transposase/invertase (TIGR01784 family)